MEKLLSDETKSALTKLGLYQLIGGAFGVLFTLWATFTIDGIPSSAYAGLMLVILIFSYSVFCGILCLKENKNALGHSLANQLLQVIQFSAFGLLYEYAAGVYMTVGLDLTESFQFSFSAGFSSISLNLNGDRDLLELKFNIVAIILVFWIDKLIKKVKEEALIREANF